MTLNEAIQHAEAIVNSQCGECAEEHRQLAEWLKELKYRREAVEQKHGHWITDKNIRPNAYSLYHCSICNSLGNVFFDYCPNCGAKMRGDDDV